MKAFKFEDEIVLARTKEQFLDFIEELDAKQWDWKEVSLETVVNVIDGKFTISELAKRNSVCLDRPVYLISGYL